MRLYHRCKLLPLLALLSAAGVAQIEQPDAGWTGTWGAAPNRSQPLNNVGSTPETIREVVHVSAAGRSIRVRLSNVFGKEPLVIGRTSVALRESGDTLKTNPVLLSFHGAERLVIPAGGSVVSDASPFDVPALADVAVSIFIPVQAIQVETVHLVALTTNYVAAGDQVLAASLSGPTAFLARPFLTDVDVLEKEKNSSRQAPAAAIVCLGDSITAGVHSKLNGNASWPDDLSARLQAVERTATWGVLNEGIPGNRVLQNIVGPSALSRFNRDVLSQTSVKYLIISEGINDVGRGYGPKAPPEPNKPTAQDLEAAYTQMAQLAHARGIKVIGATITPYGGAGYYSPAGDAVREEVNTWIRTAALSSHIYDAIVDYDRVIRAPNSRSPEIVNPIYNSGDGLHPNDAGYQAMSEAIYQVISKL